MTSDGTRAKAEEAYGASLTLEPWLPMSAVEAECARSALDAKRRRREAERHRRLIHRCVAAVGAAMSVGVAVGYWLAS